MPGRKAKPTRLKLLDGNPGKKRIPKGEPQPQSEIPSPPEHLDKYALEEWGRLSQGLYTMGLLYDVDMAVFAAYCKSYSRWRVAEEALNKLAAKDPINALVQKTSNGNLIQNVLVGTANTAARDMSRYAAEFGLTPSARARLAIDPGKRQGSKFDGLINVKK
jgi:P27 family predicted phage terminase small subunit